MTCCWSPLCVNKIQAFKQLVYNYSLGIAWFNMNQIFKKKHYRGKSLITYDYYWLRNTVQFLHLIKTKCIMAFLQNINFGNQNNKIKASLSLFYRVSNYQQSFLCRAIRDTRTCRTLFLGVTTASSSSLLSWLSLVLLTTREWPFFSVLRALEDWRWLLEWCLLLCMDTVLLLLWWELSSRSEPDSTLLRFRFRELSFSTTGSSLGASGKTLLKNKIHYM